MNGIHRTAWRARRIAACACVFLCAAIVSAFAAPKIEKKDSNGDGKIDTWIERAADGTIVMVSRDRRIDGKPDHWVYYRGGSVYMQEWDRNFDGRPDLRMLEEKKRLLEKQYDDNFDGIFEKKEMAPKKGSSGRAKTTAQDLIFGK